MTSLVSSEGLFVGDDFDLMAEVLELDRERAASWPVGRALHFGPRPHLRARTSTAAPWTGSPSSTQTVSIGNYRRLFDAAWA
ncbi:hypothetical protein [Kibdelosporangium aridum]|uniref:hypothetical protein n=1 Tax=Kibdelosporangium aridum TaxID=2030 RepID=UPI000F7A7917|nr:hypothetical protein [Kibdelosporangium aridum]